jgi:hypothetical protein
VERVEDWSCDAGPGRRRARTGGVPDAATAVGAPADGEQRGTHAAPAAGAAASMERAAQAGPQRERCRSGASAAEPAACRPRRARGGGRPCPLPAVHVASAHST